MKRRPYTEADRRKLLAPITIRSFGGKSWGGTYPVNSTENMRNYRHRLTGPDETSYGYSADRRDLDAIS